LLAKELESDLETEAGIQKFQENEDRKMKGKGRNSPCLCVNCRDSVASYITAYGVTLLAITLAHTFGLDELESKRRKKEDMERCDRTVVV